LPGNHGDGPSRARRRMADSSEQRRLLVELLEFGASTRSACR